MQTMLSYVRGRTVSVQMPLPVDEVLPGIRWGGFAELMTPAYWRGQCWQEAQLGRFRDLRLGRNLREEVAACLLGGFGMPAELGLAAYRAVRAAGLLEPGSDANAERFEEILSQPMECDGRLRQYRFPRQKANYLAGCCAKLKAYDEPESDRALRDELATFPGVGLKTASWVVRNYRGSHGVAVLDLHILRAGRQMGLFPAHWVPQTHYRQLEAHFLAFAAAISTPAGLLDAVMWDYMRRMPKVALKTPILMATA